MLFALYFSSAIFGLALGSNFFEVVLRLQLLSSLGSAGGVVVGEVTSLAAGTAGYGCGGYDCDPDSARNLKRVSGLRKKDGLSSTHGSIGVVGVSGHYE